MKYKTIFLCNHPEQVNYVYSPDRKARLAELTDLRVGTVTAEELANGGFSDVEIVFSTWGMPSLSEEELAKYLPNLKAVFYGAGATDAFVRPLLARGVKVLSAWQANAIPWRNSASPRSCCHSRDTSATAAKSTAPATGRAASPASAPASTAKPWR